MWLILFVRVMAAVFDAQGPLSLDGWCAASAIGLTTRFDAGADILAGGDDLLRRHRSRGGGRALACGGLGRCGLVDGRDLDGGGRNFLSADLRRANLGGAARGGGDRRLSRPCDHGRSRTFGLAVLWIVRTGSPWRDLPPSFGNWNTVFKRYRDWVKADVFVRLFEACLDEPDMEYAMADATIVKVHRHGQGAKGDAEPSDRPFQRRYDDQDFGLDRCARQSRPLRSLARPSLRYGGRPTAHRRSHLWGFHRRADSIYHCQTSTNAVPDHHLTSCASPLAIDAELYKWRHLIENFFCKLKEFKRIAMRADKTDQSFAGEHPFSPQP